MTDQALANMYGDADYLRIAGAAFMAMGLPRPRKFGVVDGGRRMLGDRSPGAASLVCIQGGKENQ